MASNQNQYDEQFQLLHARYPDESKSKLYRLLEKHNGDVDQVRACLVERNFRIQKVNALETRFGTALTAFLNEYPSSQSLKRMQLLRIMERFSGDVEYVRKYLQHIEAKQNSNNAHLNEELKTKYAVQLAELATVGINVNCPCVLAKLEKHHGDVDKVIEVMKVHKEKKDKLDQLKSIYASQVAQLEADGVKVKNKQLLIQLLKKANGQVDVVKQLLDERNKQRSSTVSTKGKNEKVSSLRRRQEVDGDDIDHLRRLRSAGVHGNPIKILSIFHACNQSIELTISQIEKEREQRENQSSKRMQERVALADIHDAYLSLNTRDDWPSDIEQVYLDGNNMMFVIDSLRRLCLNRAGKKTELAIAQIAAAWNEQMHIPNVELIFDSTRQVDQIGSVLVSSAQPKYKTTDDMLIEIAQRTDNHEKNKQTIVVTSDRALAIQLKHQGCQLVKSHAWFAHCAMVLTPDTIIRDESSNTTSNKIRYNLDELVHRIAKIDF